MRTLSKENYQTCKILAGYFLFWVLVFFLNVGPEWQRYLSAREVIDRAGLVTALQCVVAVIAVLILIPQVLNRGRKVLFVVILFSLLVMVSEIHILVQYFYLEPTYSLSYELFLKRFGHLTLSQRLFSPWTMKYIFFSKIPLYLFPAAILTGYNLYQKQQSLLILREQKRAAELEALKNQLNPHFIFNTLNNIYALALKKSDQTPIAIEKLSGILDYVLYRCNDKFVSLLNEIEMIENYIALEKIRYGKRLSVTFEKRVDKDVGIAPLILLTLLENACKHSTSEELNEARIEIKLFTTDDKIQFTLVNSKPAHLRQNRHKQGKIGLENMKMQLQLVYANSHQLDIEDTKNQYKTSLTLKAYHFT